MKLAIDVMGFENDPKQAINAVMDFSKHHKDVEFVLFGNKQIIGNNLVPNFKCEVIDCPDVVNMDDSPIAALRKPNSSMYQAIKYVADNKADGVLSAGSTACYVTLTCSLIKNLPGIDRPAFMPYLPTQNGKGAILLDVGANKECSGFNLYQFAKMAKIYVENVRHIHNPTSGVINIGSE